MEFHEMNREPTDNTDDPKIALLSSTSDEDDAVQADGCWDHVRKYYKQLGVCIIFFCMSSFVVGIMPRYTDDATVETLVDAHSRLFNSSKQHKHALSVSGRPDIKSFAYDLGGTTCSCLLQWDSGQYWRRVMYGAKNISAHAATMFWGYFFLRNVQWVLIYSIFNEIKEELGLLLVGAWGFSDPITNMETRYDSLINDILLAFPFCLLCRHFVLVTNAPGALPEHLDIYFVLKQGFLFITSMSLNNLFSSFEGIHTSKQINAGKIVNCIAHVFFIYALAWANKWAPCFSHRLSICTVAFWFPFAVAITSAANHHEQVAALLSFGVVGLVICGMSRIDCTCAVYVSAIILYIIIINRDAPNDPYYYYQGWCGISDSRKNACPYMTKA